MRMPIRLLRRMNPGTHPTIMLMLLCFAVSSLGCARLQQRFARRCEKCHSLCEQSRNARAQGWPEQAELLLDEAIRNRPKDVETRRQLAETLWEAGRHAEALAELDELVQLQPHDAKLLALHARLLWSNQSPVAAARAAEAALRLDPHSLESLFVKARSDASRGEYELALASYVRVLQLAPDRLDARFELAEVHIRRGHPDQACPLLREALPNGTATDEERAEVEWRLGLAYSAAERWTDAALALGRAIELRESSELDWQCLATAKSLAGQDAEGVRAMARLASARRVKEEPAGVWTELRDTVARRGDEPQQRDDSLAVKLPRDGVVPADFNKRARLGDSPPQVLRQ